jgi:hypothetical protein
MKIIAPLTTGKTEKTEKSAKGCCFSGENTGMAGGGCPGTI